MYTHIYIYIFIKMLYMRRSLEEGVTRLRSSCYSQTVKQSPSSVSLSA